MMVRLGCSMRSDMAEAITSTESRAMTAGVDEELMACSMAVEVIEFFDRSPIIKL